MHGALGTAPSDCRARFIPGTDLRDQPSLRAGRWIRTPTVSSNVRNGWKADVARGPSSLQHWTMRTVASAFLVGLSLAGCHQREAPRACVSVLPGWLTAEPPHGDLFVSNVVRLAGHRVLWNGAPIDEPTLVDYTRQLAPRSPVPFLVFDPGSSPDCSFARHVQNILDQNYPCRKGACGQGPTSNFIPRPNEPRMEPKR